MGKAQFLLRVSAVLVLALTASLVGSNSQTKVLLIRKKATFRDLDALYVSVYVYSIAAGYNLLRLWFHYANFKAPNNNMALPWASLFLDQIVVYVTFGANTAASQASIIAITGQKDFQWMKLCNKFTRFCIQTGGAMICGYIACILMILITSFSAFNLFRHYSPNQFLILKAM